MGMFDIIGAVICLAILIAFCLCCTRTCRRKKQPENRRKRRRQQKNARRKRRRQQSNCPGPHPPPVNPQTRIQIANPPLQQQQINVPSVPVPPPGFQAALPHQQYPNSSSQPHLQFHNQQYLNLSQPPQTQQLVFAQPHVPHMATQQGDLYPFPPPPYEPPEHLPTQRQLETRIAMPGLDINQFARPPPPPYDEELQRSEPFKLN